MPLIPPSLLDVVVAIGVTRDDGSVHWLGTGFFYCRVMEHFAGDAYNVRGYLVTNRHVASAAAELVILFTPRGSLPAKITLAADVSTGESIWVGHPNPAVDVAVTGALHGALKQIGLVDRLPPLLSTKAFSVERMKALEIVEGDSIFVAGFPMGIVTRPSSPTSSRRLHRTGPGSLR